MQYPAPLPVYLTLAGRPVVVVGGGPVGRRKAETAADAGAAVQIISPQPRPAGFVNRSIGWISEPYRPGHLDGAMLVFAAGPAAVNAAVVADAAARGVWACDAADPGRGSFVLPAVARAGRLTAAVGTGGASPALARRLAEKLRSEFDAAFADWVELLAELRAEAMTAVPDPARRRAVLDELADWSWLDRLRGDGVDATRAAMRAFVRGWGA